MPVATKLVYGDQMQIRLDPASLEAKNRGEWGQLYLNNQAKKARLFSNAAVWHVASVVSFFAAVHIGSFFLFIKSPWSDTSAF